MTGRNRAGQDEWLAMVRDAVQVVAEATAYRDQIVRKAFTAGVVRQQIADELGITRARLYQIIDGK